MNSEHNEYDAIESPTAETSSPSRRSGTASRRETERRFEARGTRTGWATALAYLVSDAIVLALGATIAWWTIVALGSTLFQSQRQLLAAYLAMFPIVFYARGLYTTFPNSPVLELKRLVTSAVLIAGCFLGALIAGGNMAWPVLATIVIVATIGVFGLPSARGLVRTYCSRAPWWGRRVLIVGSTTSAATIARHLERRSHLGLRPVGLVDSSESGLDAVDPEFPLLGHASDLETLAVSHDVDTGLLVMPPQTLNECDALLRDFGSSMRRWIVIPDMGELPSLWGEGSEVAGLPAIAWRERLCRSFYQGVKRAFDLTVSLALLPFILLVIGAVWLAIRCTSRGPAFYSHTRLGHGGKPFRIWKFRTMYVDADKILERVLEEDEERRAEWKREQKLKNDPRVTKIGKYLRKASLDELPQIWNVLRGDMSLVGPRPIVSGEIERYGDAYAYYCRITPGVTGLWQISGRSNTSYAERVQFDAYYVRNWSPWLDVYILASTIRVVMRCEGAY